jgi:hypothetical protein
MGDRVAGRMDPTTSPVFAGSQRKSNHNRATAGYPVGTATSK